MRLSVSLLYLIFLILGADIVFFVNGVETKPMTKTAKLYYDGEAALQSGEWEKAAKLLSQFVKTFEGEKDSFAWGNLGLALFNIGETVDGFNALRRAIDLHPSGDVYYGNLAAAHWSQGDVLEAIRLLRIATRLNPFDRSNMALLAKLSLYTCSSFEWWELMKGKINHLLIEDIIQGEKANSTRVMAWDPSQSLLLPVDPHLATRVAALYTQQAKREVANVVKRGWRMNLGEPAKRLRLGYLSYSFGAGVRNGLMTRVFESHSRDAVEVFGFALRPHDAVDNATQRRHIEQTVEHFVDISALDIAAVAETINARSVHVLVDLLGLHDNGVVLYQILALEPAAVQIAYMAFAGSTGADFVHYFAADVITAPPEIRSQFSEALLYLPGTYHVNSHAARIPLQKLLMNETTQRVAKLQMGIDPSSKVLCSCNQYFKTEPEVFNSWLEVLRRNSRAVLVFAEMSFHPQVIPLFRNLAEKQGIDASRIMAMPNAPLMQHVVRLRACDAHVDTRLQSGHTTSVDMLWAGIPVVALPGRSMVSRASSAIIDAGNVRECIARDLADYENLIERTIADTKAARNLRTKIENQRQNGTLFDTARWVRTWEKTLAMAAETAFPRQQKKKSWHLVKTRE